MYHRPLIAVRTTMNDGCIDVCAINGIIDITAENEDEWLYGKDSDETSYENDGATISKSDQCVKNEVKSEKAAKETRPTNGVTEGKNDVVQSEKVAEGERSAGEDDDEDENASSQDDEEDDNINVIIGDINAPKNTSDMGAHPQSFRRPNIHAAKAATVTKKAEKLSLKDILGPGTINGIPVHEFDMATVEDKKWRKTLVDLTDFFNYGFTEISWKRWTEKLRSLGGDFTISVNLDASTDKKDSFPFCGFMPSGKALLRNNPFEDERPMPPSTQAMPQDARMPYGMPPGGGGMLHGPPPPHMMQQQQPQQFGGMFPPNMGPPLPHMMQPHPNMPPPLHMQGPPPPHMMQGGMPPHMQQGMPMQGMPPPPHMMPSGPPPQPPPPHIQQMMMQNNAMGMRPPGMHPGAPPPMNFNPRFEFNQHEPPQQNFYNGPPNRDTFYNNYEPTQADQWSSQEWNNENDSVNGRILTSIKQERITPERSERPRGHDEPYSREHRYERSHRDRDHHHHRRRHSRSRSRSGERRVRKRKSRSSSRRRSKSKQRRSRSKSSQEKKSPESGGRSPSSHRDRHHHHHHKKKKSKKSKDDKHNKDKDDRDKGGDSG